MPNLNSYLNFTVVLDKSSSIPVFTLQDTSSYPTGVPALVQGVVSVTQPDGITVAGSVLTPDITWNGTGLNTASKELRLCADGTLQKGIYTVSYIVNATGYTQSSLTKTFVVNYDAIPLSIQPIIDAFTPVLKVNDNTYYSENGLVFVSATRAWDIQINTAGATTAYKSATTQLVDLIYSGNYYDAEYVFNLSVILTMTLSAPSSFVSIIDKLTASSTYDVYTPLTITQMLAGLDTLQTQANSDDDCGCTQSASERYDKALDLYNEFLSKGRSGVYIGTDVISTKIAKLINGCNTVLSHTNAPIPAYNWSSGGSSTGIVGIEKEVSFTVGATGSRMNAGDTVLTISDVPIGGTLQVFADGTLISPNLTDRFSYLLTVGGSSFTITFNQPLVAGQFIDIFYQIAATSSGTPTNQGTTFYTAPYAGITTVVFTDLVGRNASLINVVKQFQPLKSSQYSWNASTATITLIGLTLDYGETLFGGYIYTI
jgi:hypothetical protein